jgi:hypothetical protein
MMIVLSKICTLSVNLKQLPSHAFVQETGRDGIIYYRVSYEVAMRFGTVLEFELIWNGKVAGTAVANYV